MKIIIANTKILAKKAGERLTELLRENKDKEIFLLSAGGSCIAALEYVPVEVLGPHLTIGPLDDRFNFDPKINNWMIMQKTGFYKRAVEADTNTADILPTKDESKEELAARYDEILHEWRIENPDGVMVGLFGVGEDGHIGSMMPFPENPKLFSKLFEDKEKWVSAYDAGTKNKYSERWSATISFLKENLSCGVAFVSGTAKLDSLKKISATAGALSATPSRILRDLPEITLFTDQSFTA